MKINAKLVSPQDYPVGSFARIIEDGESLIVEVFHRDYQDERGQKAVAVYYWSDPDHPEISSPLSVTLSPEPLGSYESIIQSPQARPIFMSLIEAATEVPRGIYLVRAIHWILKRGGLAAYEPRLIAKQALSAVNAQAVRLRQQRNKDLSQFLQPDPQ